MSAPISRSRAVMVVVVFAVIVAAWATVQAGVPKAAALPCTIEPCSTDPEYVCNYEVTTAAGGNAAGSQPCSDGKGVAVGTANGEVEEDTGNANNQLTDAQSGSGPAGLPGVTGAPLSDTAGSYQDLMGTPFAGNSACAALTTDVGSEVGSTLKWAGDAVKDPATILPPPPSSGTRSTLGDPCGHENRYACWDIPLYAHRDYTGAIYWHWGTYMKWCGYSLGAITSRTYDDHNVLATGFNCTHDYSKDEVRTPLEKINQGHWQQHSNFAFFCKVGGAWKQDHPTEGAHYYSNGYHEDIYKSN